MKLIINSIQSIAYGMTVIGGVGKLCTEMALIDIESQFKGIDGIMGIGDTVLITVVSRRKQDIALVIKNMFPFDIGVLITVTISRIVIEIEPVGAHIAHHIERILWIEYMRDTEIAVIEISLTVAISAVGNGVEEPVRIGGSEGGYQRGLFFL